MATDYGDVNYWNKRFSERKEAFEWLKPSHEFMPHIKNIADAVPEKERVILHIGSGTSNLSLQLRSLVLSPHQVRNVDYSIEAVRLGQQMEDNSTGTMKKAESSLAGGDKMLWSRADLLDAHDVQALLSKGRLYNIIIDKSTSDSIACGSEVEIDPTLFTLPNLPVTVSPSDVDNSLSESKLKMIPMYLLALHMAAITATDAYWLVLSFSESRFYFLEKINPFHTHLRTFSLGELEPAKYWLLESKEEINRTETCEANGAGGHIVYRPVTVDWLYRLRRTDRPLQIAETQEDVGK